MKLMQAQSKNYSQKSKIFGEITRNVTRKRKARLGNQIWPTQTKHSGVTIHKKQRYEVNVTETKF